MTSDDKRAGFVGRLREWVADDSTVLDGVIAAIWGMIGIFAVVMCIIVAYLGATGAPFWDQWLYIDPSDYLRHPLQLQNGQHPILIGRLLFALDYYAFAARGWFLQWTIFASMGVEALAFVLLARLGGIRDLCGTLVTAGFATAMVFNPLLDENITWAFQPPFVLAFSAGVVAAYGLAAYAKEPRGWALALSLVGSFVALVSLANGVFISALLVPLAWYLKLPRRVMLMHIAVVLLAIPVFFGPGTERGGVLPQTHFASIFVPYALSYLGGGFGRVPMYVGLHVAAAEAVTWSLWIGAAMFAGGAFFVFMTARGKSRDAVTSALATLIVYILLTACLTAVGRLFFGLQSSISGRYASAGGLFAAALGIGAALSVMHMGVQRSVQRILLLIGAGLVVWVPLSGLGMADQTAAKHRDFTFAQTALVTDVPDWEKISTITPFGMIDYATKGARSLKAAHKSLFEDQWSRAIGQRYAFGALPECGGDMQSGNRQTISAGFVRLAGWVAEPAVADGRIVVIAHPDGLIAGYGVVSKSASDLVGGLLFAPGRRLWVGHMRVDANSARESLIAYLADSDSVKCRIAELAHP